MKNCQNAFLKRCHQDTVAFILLPMHIRKFHKRIQREREKRDVSEKVLIMSAQSKIPRNFRHFLNNGDNKTRLIELIKEYLVDNKQEVLNRLDCNEIYFSMDRVCYRVTDTDVNAVDCLSRNQGEADTKLLLHAKTMHLMPNKISPLLSDLTLVI